MDRKIFSLLIALGVAGLTTGCSNDGNGENIFDLINAPLENTANIGAEGGTLRSTDGRLALTIPPGALGDSNTSIPFRITRTPELDTQTGPAYTIEPAGLVFAEAVNISFDPGDATGNDLAIALFGGNQPLPLQSTLASNGRLQAQVTHLSSFGLTRATPLPTREAAAALIRQTYVNALPTRFAFITGPAEQLQAGDTVRQGFGSFQPPAQPGGESQVVAAEVTTIESPTWFFWVDLEPNAGFQHNNIYLFIDPETGTLREEKALWWPVVNGEPLATNLDERRAAETTVYAAQDADAATLAPLNEPGDSTGSSQSARLAGPPLGTTATTRSFQQSQNKTLDNCSDVAYLVIQTSNDLSYFDSSADAMELHLNNSVDQARVFRYNFEYRQAGETAVSQLSAAFSRIRKQGCYKKVFIYITSHGNDSGLVSKVDGVAGNADSDEGDRAIGWQDVLDELTQVQAEDLTILIESCESGGFVQFIESGRETFTPENGQLTPDQAESRAPLLCTNLNVIYTADVGEYADAGFPIGNTTLNELFFTGRLFNFTEQFLDQLADSDEDPTDFSGAGDRVIASAQGFTPFNVALNDDDPGRSKFEPLQFEIVEPLDSDGDGLSDDDELNEFFTDPNNPDTDGDGIPDGMDPDPLTPDTSSGGNDDLDEDGTPDNADACPGTEIGAAVDGDGCSAAQLDAQMAQLRVGVFTPANGGTNLESVFILGLRFAGYSTREAQFLILLVAAESLSIIDLFTGDILQELQGTNQLGAIGITQAQSTQAQRQFRSAPGSVQQQTSENPPAAAIFAYNGNSGFLRNSMDDGSFNDGGNVSLGPVIDAFPSGNDVVGNEIVVCEGANAFAIQYSAQFDVYARVNSAINVGRSCISTVAATPDGPVLAASRTQGRFTDSRLYFTDRSNAATEIGVLGVDARRVRHRGNIAAATLFGDDALRIISWDGQNTPTIVGAAVPVGDGPVDLDLFTLSNGNTRIVSTGFNDSSVTLTEVNSAGAVVSNNSFPAPQGCVAPGHAVFTPNPDAPDSPFIIGTCFTSGNYFVATRDSLAGS